MYMWQVGVAMFAGLGVMVVLLPFNGFITAKVGKYQKQQMAKKDERLKLMNEILNGIKVSGSEDAIYRIQNSCL